MNLARCLAIALLASCVAHEATDLPLRLAAPAPKSTPTDTGRAEPGDTEDPPVPDLEVVDLGWRATLVADGTKQGTFPGLMGIAVLEGGTDVVTVHVMRGTEPDSATDPDPQQTSAVQWRCDDGCAVPARVAETPMGPEILWGGVLPSVAVRPGPTGAPVVHVVRLEKVQEDCDGDGVTHLDAGATDLERQSLDLVEWEWDTDADALTQRIIDANPVGACHHRGLSLTRHQDGELWTCFTHKGGERDAVWCAVRPDGEPTWDTSLRIDNGDAPEDHASFVVRNGWPLVASHRFSTDDGHAIQTRDLADSGGPVTHQTSSAVVNHPAMAMANDGRVHLVWSDGISHASSIRHTTCSGDRTCRNRRTWDSGQAGNPDRVHEVWTGLVLQHTQIVVDGEKQLVAFMQAEEDAEGRAGTRVLMTERCGEGPWSTPELLRAPDARTEYQLIHPGRPALAIDTARNLVHVAMVELNDEHQAATDAQAWWLHRRYEDCGE